MIRLTKIVQFETAHAIHGYDGACKNIHGHSYELHVTVSSMKEHNDFIPDPGFEMDFKDIKKIVKNSIVEKFDHQLILSKKFIDHHPAVANLENKIIWEMEPSAENMLLVIKHTIEKQLPSGIRLVQLKLYETKDSYAEWIA